MPFLLMVFLTLICLPELNDWPPPLVGKSAEGAAAATWAGVGLVALAAAAVAQRVRRPLVRDPGQRERVLVRYERERFFHLVLLYGTYATALLVLGWGWAVSQAWKVGGQPLPGGELVLLSPFLAGFAVSLAFFYDADRASQRAARRLAGFDAPDGAGPGAEGPPAARPRLWGGRLGYVLFQMRQRLALVLIPVLLLLALKEAQRAVPDAAWARWEPVVNAAGLGAMAAVFVGLPWLIRLALGLKPLAPGPLRDRLRAVGGRLGFRCSNILVWNTRRSMANAMVVGLLPWPRYVVFTDRLLEEFEPEEVDAVFGHEVGHARHRHMLYYLGFLTVSMAVLWKAYCDFPWLGQLADGLGCPGSWLGPLAERGYLQGVPVVGLLLAYIFVVFGFLSRRCERQADVYGCRAVSCPDPDCAGHGGGAPAGGLCPTGIRTFIRALERVAAVNGISRDRPGFLQSWQHSTIARRVAFLEGILADPAAEPRFQRRVALVKGGLLAAVLAVLLALFLTGGRKARDAEDAEPPGQRGSDNGKVLSPA
jgi:Zn-dependent protease with chaperone function